MPLDDYATRGRHLSDDDPAADEPLELPDEGYGVEDEDEVGEFVDEEDEEEKTLKNEGEEELPPTIHIREGALDSDLEDMR